MPDLRTIPPHHHAWVRDLHANMIFCSICKKEPPSTMDLLGVIEQMREDVVRYVVSQGPHMPDAWKDFFAESFDLERDMGNPYQHLVKKKVT